MRDRTSTPTVLFAPGAGGDPARYSALIDAIRDEGFHVIAPVSERFDPRTVTTSQLQARVDDLHRALAHDGDVDSVVSVVGHSVGAWAALCLAGAQPWDKDGRPIEVRANPSTLPPHVSPTPVLDHAGFLRELAGTVTAQLA